MPEATLTESKVAVELSLSTRLPDKLVTYQDINEYLSAKNLKKSPDLDFHLSSNQFGYLDLMNKFKPDKMGAVTDSEGKDVFYNLITQEVESYGEVCLLVKDLGRRVEYKEEDTEVFQVEAMLFRGQDGLWHDLAELKPEGIDLLMYPGVTTNPEDTIEIKQKGFFYSSGDRAIVFSQMSAPEDVESLLHEFGHAWRDVLYHQVHVDRGSITYDAYRLFKNVARYGVETEGVEHPVIVKIRKETGLDFGLAGFIVGEEESLASGIAWVLLSRYPELAKGEKIDLLEWADKEGGFLEGALQSYDVLWGEEKVLASFMAKNMPNEALQVAQEHTSTHDLLLGIFDELVPGSPGGEQVVIRSIPGVGKLRATRNGNYMTVFIQGDEITPRKPSITSLVCSHLGCVIDQSGPDGLTRQSLILTSTDNFIRKIDEEKEALENEKEMLVFMGDVEKEAKVDAQTMIDWLKTTFQPLVPNIDKYDLATLREEALNNGCPMIGVNEQELYDQKTSWGGNPIARYYGLCAAMEKFVVTGGEMPEIDEELFIVWPRTDGWEGLVLESWGYLTEHGLPYLTYPEEKDYPDKDSFLIQQKGIVARCVKKMQETQKAKGKINN